MDYIPTQYICYTVHVNIKWKKKKTELLYQFKFYTTAALSSQTITQHQALISDGTAISDLTAGVSH